MSRILVIAHGHPELSPGGGELAAAAQCSQLRALGHEVLFVARVRELSGHGGTPFTLRGADVLFHSPNYDHFLHVQRAKWAIHKDFRALIERFAPDVVHLHHYVHIGLDLIRELRKYDASMPIVLTLHEYLAICHNHGQFLKVEGGLCYKSGPLDCHGCYPGHAPQDFFLRERFIKSFLFLVDRFVCPSRFLLERYAAWGLPRERLVLLENGQEPGLPAADEPPAAWRRFGFFGQLSDLKGVRVLLQAMALLPAQLRGSLQLDIHGTLNHQGDAFIAEFHAAVAALGGVAHYHGPYQPGEQARLMGRVGWVVVPSLWWENSPLVIQEAFGAGRPVLCSDIGGMAEKVRDGVDGLHVRVGDPRDLAECMARAADPVLWQRLCAGIQRPPTIGATTQTLLTLYEAIRGERSDKARIAKRFSTKR